MKIDVDRCVNEGAASRGRSEPRIREETHAAVPAVVRASGWVPYKWELVVLLWFTFFLHQADRQIYGNLLPLIKSDLQLSDVQLGLVASVFTAVFGVCVLIGGYAGDVLRRKWIVLASLMIFSVATLLSGLSTGLLMLIVFRGLATGGGEAIYYPAASSLIAQFHHRSRATALGIHQTAIYVGLVASCVAGYVGEFYGWRSAFFVFGGFGVALGVILPFRMQDTPQVAAESPESRDRIPLGEVLRGVLGKSTALMLSAAMAGHVFVNIGYLTWAPTFLHERFGMTITAAAFAALAYHHAFAFVGVLVGARLSDRWAPRRRTVRMEIECAGLLLASPFILWMGQSSNAIACCVAMAIFGFFRGVYDSNLWPALFDVIEPRLRSSATGAMLSCAFIVGAVAPMLMGWAKEPLGLSGVISCLAGVYFASSVVIFIALHTSFARDYLNP